MITRVSANVSADPIVLEAGQLAPQAHGAVLVRHRQSALLATVVAVPDDAERDFFPLTVEYRERMSAAGRVPGNYQRREGRLTDREVLVSRLVDRALRPLFPAGFRAEVQVLVTVYGADERSDLEALAILAASAALHVSDVPFDGPVAAARLVARGGKELALASEKLRSDAEADWLVAGTRGGVVMIEGAAAPCPDEAAIAWLGQALASTGPLLDALDQLRAEVGKDKRAFAPVAAGGERAAAREALRRGERADGRRLGEVRPIAAEVGFLPGNHGSAVFSRGETQALVSVTLGGSEDAQDVESVFGKTSEHFLLHYNFPPFATGEARAQRGPGRREIGHGALARRALQAVLPRREELPWVIRVVSDILSSNGSSSMATVCGGSLALMDAGVPIAAPVAGVAMGLVREDGADTVLTDITGAEDGAGDMDLKVAGTRDGLTAIQLDNKLGAIPLTTLVTALAEARGALLLILAKMDEVLAAPRAQVAPNAPQVGQIQVAKRHVGRIIGPGGKRVNEIQAQTRSRIDIKDSGRIRVSAKSAEDLAQALQILRDEATDLKLGEIYDAEVVSVKEYGAFVRVGAHEGLVHVSELEEGRTDKVSDLTKVGDRMRVKVLGADARGRLELSRRAALEG